ncbi:MAG: hypothetical protein ACQEP1_06385 [Nanobdellota archaeon]
MDIFIGKESEEVTRREKELGNEFVTSEKMTILENPSRSKLGRDVDVVYGLEGSDKPDFVHHRNSGMNQVLAKIFSDKDIMVGFSFSLVLNSRKPDVILGRMRQNVMLCRKYDVKMVFGNFASEVDDLRSMDDLKSFASMIGMKPDEIKRSLSHVSERLEYNDKKREGKVFRDIAWKE